MKQPTIVALALLASIVSGGAIRGWTQELGDPGFEALRGKTVGREAVTGEWSIPPGPPYADNIDVQAEAASARGGKVGLRLQPLVGGRVAAVHQPIPQLAAGIYEFKVWAKGKGVLVLRMDTRRRRGDLAKDWAEYSLTFEQSKAGPADLAILADGNAQVDDTSLAAASSERVAAWQQQEKVRAEYGFVPEYFAAQSPQPGAPGKPAGIFQGGPVTWREKVVFYDQTYDNVWITHPETIAQYLGANGFKVLAAAPFAEWMKNVTKEGASGTVCVMAHGLCPGAVYDRDQVKASPIRKYLEAGGRVVWLGEMPFLYLEDDVHPQLFHLDGPGEILGVRYSGDKGEPKVSPLGQTWGLAEAGGPAIVGYAEDTTAPLSNYHSDYADSDLTPDWFKNFNPLYPWSGLIMCYRANDLAKPALQQSVYRLALYAGQPIAAPAGIVVPKPAVAAAPLKVVLDPPRNRHCYYRGEKIPVRLEAGAAPEPAVGRDHRAADAGDGVPPNGRTEGGLRLSLVRHGKSLAVTECPPPTKAAPRQTAIATADLACGDYQLKILGPIGGQETVLYETTVSLCPRRDDPVFFFGVKGAGNTSNPYRQEMMLKDFVASGLNLGSLTIDTPPSLFDLALKYGLRFSLRAHGSIQLTDAEREAAERRGPNGEKVPGAWEAGRPMLGLLHPKRRQLDAADMARQVNELSAWPDCWPRCETSDDFAVYYGWDYSNLAKRLFQEKTGLAAPVPPELAKQGVSWPGPGAIAHAPGIIADNDPWLQWSRFTTKEIAGGYNKALMDACAAAVPGIKVGPLPGSMMFPLWQEGQYPPDDFGPGGFNMIHYYMYLNHWSPMIANLYWDEVGRINNRDLEAWTSPDCGAEPAPTYYRNTFFLHLAGGCQGINYFNYPVAKPEAWQELGRLGNQVVRPLAPFLGKLRPARTSVGLLLPYTQSCYQSLWAVSALYPYANLLGAHVDVQPTCEEEVLAGAAARYKVILLWRVQYLRQSVVTALENYIAKGGVVISDATTQVPIKGAVKTSVDLAMGGGKSNPDPSDPRLGGPGILDYLHPDRVALVRQTVEPYARPWADCADPTLIARRHGYRGVTYLWLVNIESQEEYEYIRPRTATAAPANPEQAARDYLAYVTKRAIGQRFRPRVTIPAGHWAAYDVLKGQRVPLEKAGDRRAFTADMERLGGTLVALYPEPIARVTATLATGAAQPHGWFGFGRTRIVRGQSAMLRVTVRGPSGQPLPGTQPLAVTVLTPQGEWAEITGAHATEDGVWPATIRPASNDPAGTWKIRVKELSSGLTAETAFAVK